MYRKNNGNQTNYDENMNGFDEYELVLEID